MIPFRGTPMIGSIPQFRNGTLVLHFSYRSQIAKYILASMHSYCVSCLTTAYGQDVISVLQ